MMWAGENTAALPSGVFHTDVALNGQCAGSRHAARACSNVTATTTTASTKTRGATDMQPNFLRFRFRLRKNKKQMVVLLLAALVGLAASACTLAAARGHGADDDCSVAVATGLSDGPAEAPYIIRNFSTGSSSSSWTL
jgi:hypothetical protein